MQKARPTAGLCGKWRVTKRFEEEWKMNANVEVDMNPYERIAINLAELIDEISAEREERLHQLLSSAYQAAYRKAAEETEQQSRLADAR